MSTWVFTSHEKVKRWIKVQKQHKLGMTKIWQNDLSNHRLLSLMKLNHTKVMLTINSLSTSDTSFEVEKRLVWQNRTQIINFCKFSMWTIKLLTIAFLDCNIAFVKITNALLSWQRFSLLLQFSLRGFIRRYDFLNV